MRGAFVQSLIRRPWARALAIVGTYLLTLQAAGIQRFAIESEACCCAHMDAKCGCRVCSHNRELESGQPTMKSCGTTGESAVVVLALDSFLPAELSSPPRVVPVEQPKGLVDLRPPDPVRDVPTPPPLARS
jgi:hypothetical protein